VLPWGTTLLVVTGQVEQDLLNELHQARRSGQNALLILAGSVSHVKDIQKRAAFFGVPTLAISKESELDVWRR
jgi:HPt (histidine-containing phosphotransfer) domain-containing protein